MENILNVDLLNMDSNEFQKRYVHKNFIVLFVMVFIFLSVFCSFIKFFSQWPVLIIVTFLICVFLQNRYNLGKPFKN